MLFRVQRTSDHGDTKRPCKGAVKRPFTCIDVRSVDDPAKIPAYHGDTSEWYANGSNHRVVNGNIMRDMEDRTGWFLEINSLEELIALQTKEGQEIILGECWDMDDTPRLEIYDTYRE